VLRGYSSVYVLPGPDGARAGALLPLATLPAPQQPQGESLAVVDGGASALLGSEGLGEPLLRLVVAGPPATTAPPAASAVATPVPGAAPGSSGPPTALLVAAAAALLAVLAMIGVLVRR
jgi:hypothetical protein